MTNTNGFLPENYELPKGNSGKYTKFENGTTRIRILSSCLVGWEYFDTEKKVHRQKTRFEKTPWIEEWRSQKEFWAFVVWNYNTENIEICQLTQKWLKEAILNYCKDSDWWDPKNRYDLKITRTWEKLDTSYQVNPWIPSATEEFILEEFKNTNIVLEALFEWKNPFDYKVESDEFNDEKYGIEDLPL